MNPDDLTVFDEAPARYLHVPTRAIGSGGRRGRYAIVAWLATIVLVAGLAVGHVEQPPAVSLADQARPAVVDEPSRALGPTERPARIAPAAVTATRPVQVIDLASPGPGMIRITSDRLTIAGKLLVKADTVDIVLSANGNRLFGEATVDVSDPDGGIRPAYMPAFEVQFNLATPRPMGTLIVVVTAYDAAGARIGGLNRAVSIEPLAGG